MPSQVLLYLHGLGSSGDSDTGRFLEARFGQRLRVVRPSYRPQFFAESVQSIDALIAELRAAYSSIAVLGSSMGGWHALHALARHRDLSVTALNPVLDPQVLRTAPRATDVDQRSGQPLPWPELNAANFPAAPVDELPAAHLHLLIGVDDDVVPPEPTLSTCRRLGWSHQTFPWGHRAELDERFAAAISDLLQRA